MQRSLGGFGCWDNRNEGLQDIRPDAVRPSEVTSNFDKDVDVRNIFQLTLTAVTPTSRS